MIVHRLIISLFLLGVTQIQAATTVHDVHVQVQPSGEQFQVVADFKVGLSLCQAVTFIRDYEAAKNFPGIKESKIINRTGNQVLVERIVEEQILYIPITMQSVVQYKEVSDQLLEFRQITGDAKYYQGVWRLIPEGNSIRFQYLAMIELSSIVPHSIAEYFIKNQMTKRFEAMAENATQRMNQKQLACR